MHFLVCSNSDYPGITCSKNNDKDINLLQFHINELIITDWGDMYVKGNRVGKVF